MSPLVGSTWVNSGHVMSRRSRSESGIAVLASLMLMVLLVTLGVTLILVTTTETKISASYRDGIEAFYAAEGAIARVVPDLAALDDWNVAFAGGARSSFVDGLPGTKRTLADGTVLDLAEATNMARCGSFAACTDAAMDAVSEDRPWGRNNPRWQLFAYGRVEDLLPGRIDAHGYLVVWIGDDPFENDDKPLEDGALPANPGRGAAALRAHAYGTEGQRRMIEVTIARSEGRLRLLTWRELR